jgi:hypothetical protein
LNNRKAYKWQVNNGDLASIRFLFDDRTLARKNGKLISVPLCISPNQLDEGDCKLIKEACDRFFEKRKRINQFLTGYKALKNEQN